MTVDSPSVMKGYITCVWFDKDGKRQGGLPRGYADAREASYELSGSGSSYHPS